MTTTVQGETWYDASDDPVYISGGQDREDTAILKVDPLGGDVQIQFRDSAGDWVTPADGSFTIEDFTVVDIPLWNVFPIRIIASGSAKFSLRGV